jgi:hypothetical protein
MVGPGIAVNDRYRLERRLGGGGMGEVWLAEDLVLGRKVAVKLLLPALMDDPGFTARFQREARALAALRHPGVVDVYDYGSCVLDDGGQVTFLVMQFIDGESLDAALQRGPLSPTTAMRLVAEVADALAAAHEQGIVHRDVKPANLMLRQDGLAVLTDFGIARSGSGEQLTAHGMMLCSVGYCAPEQATAEEITPAVDVYALGVVAFECLTGRLPFEGETPVQIVFKHLNAPPPELPATLPEVVREVVSRAMRKDPAERWPSAERMAEAARRAAAMVTGAPGAGTTAGTGAATGAASRPGPPMPGAPAPQGQPPGTGDVAPALAAARPTGPATWRPGWSGASEAEAAFAEVEGFATVPGADFVPQGARRRRASMVLVSSAVALLVTLVLTAALWTREPGGAGVVFTPSGTDPSAPASVPGDEPERAPAAPAPPQHGTGADQPGAPLTTPTAGTPTPAASPTPPPSEEPSAEPSPSPSASAEPAPSQEPVDEPSVPAPGTAPPQEHQAGDGGDLQCVTTPCP